MFSPRIEFTETRDQNLDLHRLKSGLRCRLAIVETRDQNLDFFSYLGILDFIMVTLSVVYEYDFVYQYDYARCALSVRANGMSAPNMQPRPPEATAGMNQH